MGQAICLENRHNDSTIVEEIFGRYSSNPDKDIIVKFNLDDFYYAKRKKRRKKKKKKN